MGDSADGVLSSPPTMTEDGYLFGHWNASPATGGLGKTGLYAVAQAHGDPTGEYDRGTMVTCAGPSRPMIKSFESARSAVSTVTFTTAGSDVAPGSHAVTQGAGPFQPEIMT